MRQVNQDELVYLLQGALRKLSASQIAAMRHARSETSFQARVIAARIIAQDLARLEILSSAPEPGAARFPIDG